MDHANNSIPTEIEYEIDRWTPIREALRSEYYGTTDEDDFHPDDLKELHPDIVAVKVDKIWYEHRDVIDEVCITFYLTNDEKFDVELERGYEDHWVEKDGWY